MISEILPEEKRRLHELEAQLLSLEQGDSGVNAYDISIGVDEMTHRLAEMDRLVNNEPKSRREDFRRRVDHLKNSQRDLRGSLDAFARRTGVNLSHQGLSQRARLFADAATNGGDGGGDATYDEESGTGSRRQGELNQAESSTLNRSGRMVNDYLKIGQETLSELYEQKSRLKGVQKKALDIANYLGISNNIIKAVTDREVCDSYITYIGMVVVLVVMVLLWWWRR